MRAPSDPAREYDEMLDRGLRLTGESKHYFAERRVDDLCAELERLQVAPPRRVLDFGCGVGDTCKTLAQRFPEAHVVGIDVDAEAIAHARARHSHDRIRFELLHEFTPEADFDLCYCNGVFHHIEPPERVDAARIVWRALRAGGRFALVENNPWNPGTRLVMSRIPIDAGTVPLSAPTALQLLHAAGFTGVEKPRFLFFFPRPLAFLRFLEHRFVRVPLGGQYHMIATKSR